MVDATTLAAMEWGECWVPPGKVPADLAAEVKKAVGILPGWATRLSPVPWLVRACARLNQKTVAYMPLELFDRITLLVSQDNSCRYCYGLVRAMLSVQGYADDSLDRIERELYVATVAPAEVAAFRFARKVSLANPRPTAADLAALVDAGFERPAIAEIVFVAAISGFHNRISTFFALPPELRVERWLMDPIVRLVRPFVARRFRGAVQCPRPLVSSDGPCAAVVAALDGSPLALNLRGTIDEAFASAVLPRRTKLLLFAVIGRALGCARTEREAREGLGAEGFTPGDVDAILANLSSPRLEAREAVLVPWARETVRYRPLAIQERTRALADHMELTEVIEAAGIAALANSIARMSILLETC
jgi:alkylhydroperoxidase family enzyme